MGVSVRTEATDSPAAPFEPPYTYTFRDGYGQTSSMSAQLRTRQDTLPSLPEHQDLDSFFPDGEYGEIDGDSGHGLDNEEEEDDDWEGVYDEPIKFLNRQPHQNTNGGVALTGASQRKPSANTFARIDDEASDLSKHASKIRLDNFKQDEDKIKDKADRATIDLVLDQRTGMILLQMINSGVVSEVHGTISTGKEANVYGALHVDEETGVSTHRAIKIYKTAILVFKDRERYINGEHRFKSGYNKNNNRKMVSLWAEKEFRNLHRIRSAGIPCPEPLALKHNVLVMGFLGDRKGWAYPRLRDALLRGGDDDDDDDSLCRKLYMQLLGLMRKLYQVCHLVHADLSEFNILYHKEQLYLIDVSQSVGPDHPRSLQFLRMDIKNVGYFFRRRGVVTLSDRAVFNFILAPQGPVEEPAMAEAIEKLYETDLAATSAENEDQNAQIEVDNQVFRNQYIPQTLEQVYDVEKDAAKVHMGQGKDLVYSNLLADSVIQDDDKKGNDQEEEEAQREGSVDGSRESGEGAALGSDEEVDESIFEKGRPRGRRFQDKDEKRLHKQAVKEANREKRLEKLPKHVKKRLVLSTARNKK